MIAEEAYWTDLIGKHLAGQSTEEESARLKAWTDESGAHLQFYRECEAIWKSAGPEETTATTDIDTRWAQLEAQINSVGTPSGTTGVRRMMVRAAAVAAIALLLILGYRIMQGPDEIPQLVAVAQEDALATELTLPDGSGVWLREGSEIAYGEGFVERTVTLRGEGYFEVVHDPDRPFVVEVGQTTTRVLGTKFHLKETVAGDVELFVVEGKVAFAQENAPEQEEMLIRDQAAVAQLATGVIARVEPPDNHNALSWTTGRLTFDHEALSRVVEDLETHFRVEIVFGTPGMGNCELKTDFSHATLEDVLETICFSLNCSYTVRDGVYYITGEPCHIEE